MKQKQSKDIESLKNIRKTKQEIAETLESQLAYYPPGAEPSEKLIQLRKLREEIAQIERDIDLAESRLETGSQSAAQSSESGEQPEPSPTFGDKLIEKLRDPIWQGIGVLVAIIAIAVSVLLWYLSQNPNPSQKDIEETPSPLPAAMSTMANTSGNTSLPIELLSLPSCEPETVTPTVEEAQVRSIVAYEIKGAVEGDFLLLESLFSEDAVVVDFRSDSDPNDDLKYHSWDEIKQRYIGHVAASIGEYCIINPKVVVDGQKAIVTHHGTIDSTGKHPQFTMYELEKRSDRWFITELEFGYRAPVLPTPTITITVEEDTS